MVRYLMVSTAIVLAIVVGVAAWVHRDLIAIRIASVYAPSTKPGAASGRQAGQTAALRGDAPWALSALPECVIQTSESTGPQRYVRSRLPSGAVAIVPPAKLTFGDCTIFVVGDEAFVRRGADRLRIPPRVQFYRAGDLLVLVRESPNSELRVYRPIHP